MRDDVFVVVRSIGERTEEACIEIATSQLPNRDQLTIVKGKPFPEAHIESLQLAVESAAQWILMLDADILLKDDAIATMILEAKKIDFPFFQANFRILDRGFGGEAYGVHLYPKEYLSKALQFQNIALHAQRPEYQVCLEMAKNYHIPSISSELTVGLHGYEQFYSDLYRTTFVRAIKYKRHQNYFFKFYSDHYFSSNEEELDFKFLFWGLVDGVIYSDNHDKALLDKTFYQGKTDRIFSLLNICEKLTFTLVPDFVQTTFKQYCESENYFRNKAWICPLSKFTIEVPNNSIETKFFRLFRLILSRCKQSIKLLLFGR